MGKETSLEKLTREVEAERAAREAEEREAKAKVERARKERQAEQERQRAEYRAQLEKERAELFDKEQREPALQRWLSLGGTRAEFDRAWPGIRQDILADSVKVKQEEARRKTAQHYKRAF